MSGHSHWASIKHKKKASDAKKGKAFSKVSKLILTAVKEGGTDPNTNLKLQYAIDKAREVNMPKENVERAIKKASGDSEASKLENVMYEGFGPAGVALMAEAITDNRNRTVSEIRKVFETNGGRLGEVNSVRRFFDRKGFFTIPQGSHKEDDILNAALEAGADDAELVDEVFEISCDPKNFESVKKSLKEKNLELKTNELTFVPNNYIPVSDKESGAKILKLMETLEDHDDVQSVYANFDIPGEIMSEIGKNQNA